MRDYIHVEDLATGHLKALQALPNLPCWDAINLGSGNGHSVLAVINAFRAASGAEIPYTIGERRAGDVATSFAKADKAAALLNWRTSATLDDMCRDVWNWQRQNPQGYAQ